MSYWDEAATELDQFNALFAQVERKPKDKATLKKCVNGLNKGLKVSIWASKALTKPAQEAFLLVRREIAKLAKEKDAPEDTLLAAIERYRRALQELLDTSAPGRFTYEGFKVENEEHVADELARKVLAGLDFLRALFKKRGIDQGLLKGAIAKVELVLHDNVGAANFNSSNRVLTISVPELSRHGAGRFIDTMAGETLVHEFGHYIHLNYIRGEAKEAWDAPWEGVADLADPKNRHLRDDAKRKQKVDDLGVPTEYGKTNEREDFAETFMLFMVAPEKLSDKATYRMQRALSLSGLYGKQVMRLGAEDVQALRVAAKFRIST